MAAGLCYSAVDLGAAPKLKPPAIVTSVTYCNTPLTMWRRAIPLCQPLIPPQPTQSSANLHAPYKANKSELPTPAEQTVSLNGWHRANITQQRVIGPTAE